MMVRTYFLYIMKAIEPKGPKMNCILGSENTKYSLGILVTDIGCFLPKPLLDERLAYILKSSLNNTV